MGRFGVHTLDERVREIVVVEGCRFPLQIDATPPLRLAQVVSDHVHSDAIEPRQAVGAIEVVATSELEGLQEDVGSDISGVALPNPAPREAI
jgi:hypothetical protein